ncbi:MAG: hypothetical protein HY331_03005 [Chloroflexi bacterium]|nr:hypothetical protein [Chloroflexota bacterium]
MELNTWLRLLIRWSWLLALSAVAAGIASYQLTRGVPPEYEASARLLVGPGLNSADVNLDTLRASALLVSTYRDFASTRGVLEQAILELDLPLSRTELAAQIDTTANPDTRIIEIRVRDSSSERAAAIAAKLADLVTRSTGVGNPTPAARVTTYDVQTKGRLVTNTTTQIVPLAILAALVLSMMVALAVEYLLSARRSGRVHSADELATATGAPSLGVAPILKGGRPDSPDHLLLVAHPQTPEADQYRLIATRLWAAMQRRNVKSILICSASVDWSGAAATANLATALAERFGRVILADGMLQSPRLSALFQLTRSPGLSDLLAGRAGPEAQPFGWLPLLSVVPAGTPTPFASRLMNAARLGSLIRDLSGRADVVIVQAASPLATSDALLLASQVDAVLLVAPGTVQRDVVGRVMQDLELAGAPVIGTLSVRPVRLPTDRKRGEPAELVPVMQPAEPAYPAMLSDRADGVGRSR